MPTANLYTISQAKLEPVMRPEMTGALAAKFPASKTLSKGQLLGELTAVPGTYDAYDHTAGDGLQVLKGILMYDLVTNSAGVITNLGGPIFANFSNESVYYAGYFRCEDIPGTELDDAIAAGYCRLIQGTSTTGIFGFGV